MLDGTILSPLSPYSLVQRLETRDLLLAGLAVRRPDVQQDDLALVVGLNVLCAVSPSTRALKFGAAEPTARRERDRPSSSARRP